MAGRLAAFITPGHSLDAAIERVRLAERLGYEAVFTTHTTGRDGLMTLAAYAPRTTTIKLGTGVVPAFPRHPLSLAIEAATLDEICGGRLILGIGPSHQLTMETWYGISMERPLSRIKEYVKILRSVLTTDGAEFSGEFYRAQFGFLGYGARKDLPIHLSALAPNMLAFAGEACDGVTLWGCLPNYVRDVVAPTVRAAAEAAGRDPAAVDIVAAIPVAVTQDVAAARDAFRGEFFVYMTLPFYRRVIEAAGYGDEIKAFDDALGGGDFGAALAAISDRMLEAFAGIGSAETVRAKIAEYREAGVTLPAIGPFAGGEGAAGIEATLEAAIGA